MNFTYKKNLNFPELTSIIHPNSKKRDQNLSPSKIITLLCKVSMTLVNREKIKVVQNEKNYKGFHESQNMVNFEAFRKVNSSTINLLFLKIGLLPWPIRDSNVIFFPNQTTTYYIIHPV